MNLQDINEHREALGYVPFIELTEASIARHAALILEHAPYGEDPWAAETC